MLQCLNAESYPELTEDEQEEVRHFPCWCYT